MAQVEYIQQNLHPDGKLVTPLDVFRGAEQFVGTVVSGATVSGGGLNVKIVSSNVRMRLVGVDIKNMERGGWLEVEFRDGHFGGGRVFGPVTLNADSERHFDYNQLLGKYFTSAVHVVVTSGWTGQPLSNGIRVNVAVVQEPLAAAGLYE